MGSLTADALAALSLQEPIFHNIKYYVSGDVPDKITELLNSGGAERTQYFSDFVTHLLCGQNPNETELTEATELYEIPVVTSHWVIACVRLNKLVSTAAYNPTRQHIFGNVVACIAKVSAEDAKRLYALITFYGGRCQASLNSKCTHLICGAASGKRYTTALTFPSGKLKIVTPDWVLESIRARIQAAIDVFHPKLIVLPKPPTPIRSESRISAITGFDFEEGIAKNEVPTQNSENKDDSTQALLDKLKQRMPWNHPPSSHSSVSQTPTAMMSNTPPSLGSVKTMTQNLVQNIQKNMQSSPIMQHQYSQGGVQTSSAHMNMLQQQMQQNQQSQTQQQNLQQNQQILQQSQQVMQSNQQVIQPNQQVMQSNQQILQQTQQSMQQNQQNMQQSQQTQLHGLSAIQKQQQQLLQQRQFRMPMLHQNQNKNLQQQQVFHQQNPNVSVSQMNQIQHLTQSNQQYVQQSQSPSQTPVTTLSQAQQIQNISQMLSQSTNNMQRAQLSQQANLKQGLLTNQQQTQQQAVQNIAQHLAQSTQNLQQSQLLSQQQLLSGSVQTQQNQGGLMQQQNVQSLGLNGQQQTLSATGQGNVMVQSSQTQSPGGTSQQTSGQPAWRQQNIQMIQNAQGQHQIIRGPLVQTRNPQNQMILQQQLIQNQQNIMSNQQQSPQHAQANSQQIIQQNINSQGQPQHQILVQKQQLINNSQQQIVHAPQQVLINQHSGQQQIVVHGNQHVTLQGQQIVSQQMMAQGGQHLVGQGSQHQVLIAQPSQQMVAQSGGPQIVQQQVLNSSGQPVHQIITHAGGQQMVSPGGQQIVQGQSISWQQQQYLQQRQQIGQAAAPRVSEPPPSHHLSLAKHARQLMEHDPPTDYTEVNGIEEGTLYSLVDADLVKSIVTDVELSSDQYERARALMEGQVWRETHNNQLVILSVDSELVRSIIM